MVNFLGSLMGYKPAVVHINAYGSRKLERKDAAPAAYELFSGKSALHEQKQLE